MSKEKPEKNSSYGKKWSTHSTHEAYAHAVSVKEALLTDETLQVKIRRRVNDTFHIKTRSLVVDDSKKTQSVTKNKDAKSKNRAGRRAAKKRRETTQRR
jgi:hypothetical protein